MSTALLGHPSGAFPFRRAGRPRGRSVPACRWRGKTRGQSPATLPARLPGLAPSGNPSHGPTGAGPAGLCSMLPWALLSSRGVSSLLATNRGPRSPAFPLVDFLHTHPKASYPVLQSLDRRGEWPHTRRRRHPLRGFRATPLPRSGRAGARLGSLSTSQRIVPGHDSAVKCCVANDLHDLSQHLAGHRLPAPNVRSRVNAALHAGVRTERGGFSSPRTHDVHRPGPGFSTRHAQGFPQPATRNPPGLRGSRRVLIFPGDAQRLA